MKQLSLLCIYILIGFITLTAQSVQYNREFRVNSYTSDSQSRPCVADLSGGEFVICWESAGRGVWGQLYNKDGERINSEFQINTSTLGTQSRVNACGLKDGGFAIFWQGDPEFGGIHDIFGQLFNADGSKRNQEFQVNFFDESGQNLPRSCGLADGGFVVCWQNGLTDGHDGIYAQIFEPDGLKRGEEFLVDSGTDGAVCTVSPLASGGFVVCWQCRDFDGDDLGVYGQLFSSSGIKKGEKFQINTNWKGLQYYPNSCSLPDGNFAVCWASSRNEDNSGIFVQIFDSSGAKIGTEIKVNTHEYSYQSSPIIGTLSEGRFVICWESRHQDGSDYGIFAQLFDSTAAREGFEFQVNSYVAENQWNQHLTGLSNGNFVVCWQSRYQDGSDYGIYGKYYLGEPFRHELKSFLLQEPDFDSTVYSTTLNFNWQRSSTDFKNFFWEMYYDLYLDFTPDFNHPHIYTGILDTTYSIQLLIPAQTYFWKILARNMYGDSLWSSQIFGFYVSPAAELDDGELNLPKEFKLFDNFPNPFNPSTVISWQLAVGGNVELAVYNMLGQRVVTLISEKQNAGQHQVEWDAGKMSSGIYYYVIRAGEFSATKKMVLIR